MRDPARAFMLHVFSQYNLASRYVPASDFPLHILGAQVRRVIEECRGRISRRDTKHVNIRDVPIEVVDDSEEPGIGRPFRVDPAIVLFEKRACVASSSATQKKLHASAVWPVRRRVSLELAVRRNESLVCARLSREQHCSEYAERAHRSNKIYTELFA